MRLFFDSRTARVSSGELYKKVPLRVKPWHTSRRPIGLRDNDNPRKALSFAIERIMNPEDFSPEQRTRLTRLSEREWAFYPNPLPPPDFVYDQALSNAMTYAGTALGNLNGLACELPNPALFLDIFVKREAVLSSQIEGSRATVYDVYAGQVPLFEEMDDYGRDPELQEVLNYIKALYYGMERLKSFPLCLRFVRELHERLLVSGVRGQQATPGEFRTSQNRIGGNDLSDAFYVPPPVPQMKEALESFEHYLRHDDSTDFTHPLVRLAFIHYQFEAIHPFLDGNGRVGRILIAILLPDWKLIKEPFLYLSAYFHQNRNQYYELLRAVSLSGAWKEWVVFFLQGVKEQSEDAISRAGRLVSLRESWRQRLREKEASANAVHLMEFLFTGGPAITIRDVEEYLKLTPAGARGVIDNLINSEILKESGRATRKNRPKLFAAPEIFHIIG
jgi:Fic family protein